ncbi:hypothetical protein ALC56_13988 [Trachymyrmex septentrionalis]|uniref:Uncharacterized protein n=1 Tax=Trachymyrmex septentrionalis TaxID=34720 RepID=A0A195EVD2_9HYME|nr:hypothetical protein ALC56_13988 [Trachymyrmex septentrionalis]
MESEKQHFRHILLFYYRKGKSGVQATSTYLFVNFKYMTCVNVYCCGCMCSLLFIFCNCLATFKYFYIYLNLLFTYGNVARTEPSYPFSRKVNDLTPSLRNSERINGRGLYARLYTSTIAHTETRRDETRRDETRHARGVIGNAAFNVRGRTKLPEDYKAAGGSQGRLTPKGPSNVRRAGATTDVDLHDNHHRVTAETGNDSDDDDDDDSDDSNDDNDDGNDDDNDNDNDNDNNVNGEDMLVEERYVNRRTNSMTLAPTILTAHDSDDLR